jgi:hypothetical protein
VRAGAGGSTAGASMLAQHQHDSVLPRRLNTPVHLVLDAMDHRAPV